MAVFGASYFQLDAFKTIFDRQGRQRPGRIGRCLPGVSAGHDNLRPSDFRASCRTGETHEEAADQQHGGKMHGFHQDTIARL